MRVWQEHRPDRRPLALSVNVSARQLAHPSFLSELTRMLAQHQIDPSLLMLEITESVMLDDTERMIGRLAETIGELPGLAPPDGLLAADEDRTDGDEAAA